LTHNDTLVHIGTGIQYLEEHYDQVKTQVEREKLTADLPEEVKEDFGVWINESSNIHTRKYITANSTESVIRTV